jgi:hypothetical protein
MLGKWKDPTRAFWISVESHIIMQYEITVTADQYAGKFGFHV